MNNLLRRDQKSITLLAVIFCLGVRGHAAVPAPEKLLPDDTLLMVNAPDFLKIRQIYKSSPQSQLWNDPAMRPFKEKFLSKWNDDFVKPLERELNVHFADYSSLPQGQVTLAVTLNGNEAKDDQPPGLLLLVDTREKSSQLKTNLADLRKKWTDAGKSMKTEKLRNYDFSVLSLSSNDVPKTLRKVFPQRAQAQEASSEDESKKSETRTELIVGQAESLLIVCNSTKLVEKIVTHLAGGGTLPSLSDVAAYDANHQALFRASPAYGWVNTKAIVDIITKQASEKKEPDADDPLGSMNPGKIMAAIGFAGLKSVAFNFQNQPEGSIFQLFLAVPEGSRQGLFKILAGEAKDSNPPAFVPGDAVKFQRWRIDAQKAWATLEKMLGDISPQAVSQLNFLLDMANTAAKEKDPAFDVKKSFIGNLGDDLITYQKAPQGATATDLRSPPSLFLLGSPNPEQLAAALKSILGFLNQQAGAPTEREFLGHKIFTLPVPQLPLPMAAGKPGPPRKLNYTASGGYVAMSTDATLVEEYLRSTENQGKTLRQTSGLTEAAQKVTGPGTALFGYQNQIETTRAIFELLKKDPGSITNASPLAAIPGMPNPQAFIKDWFDFSLLPSFDKISKYFYFVVYGGSATSQGLSFKLFTPAPPQLKMAQSSGK